MTQEDKDLLLKDLSARLPYDICFYFEKMPGIFHLSSIKEDHMFPSNDFDVLLNDKFPIQWCKPYLRPMSSMTEEERRIYDILACDFDGISMANSVDWLNKNHFDYRGLIEKDLAIAVTKENNPY